MSLSGDKGVAQFKKSVKMGHPIGYSCYLTAACCRRGRIFLLLVDLGSGAAISGMRIEINTGRQKASRVEGG